MAHSSAYLQFVDPADYAALEDLELVATQIVDGFVSGGHRSKMKGGCSEFAEHRAYSPGDEVRLLDWRVYAKSDRYYIKQFDEETNLNATLILDASGSMGFGASTASKFLYARAACACLARLLLGQRDPVGFALSQFQKSDYVPPRSTATHFRVFLDRLGKIEPAGITALLTTLDELIRRAPRRGVFLIFSDCFVDIPALHRKLEIIRGRGHQVVVFHTMAPEELEFRFDSSARFRCLEVDGYHLDLDPVTIRNEYLEGVRRFLDQLEKACTSCGCDYVPLNTGAPLGETLARYLRQRSARIRR